MEEESSGCVGLLGCLGKWGGIVRGADLWCQERELQNPSLSPSEEEHKKGQRGNSGCVVCADVCTSGKKDMVAEIRSHP